MLCHVALGSLGWSHLNAFCGALYKPLDNYGYSIVKLIMIYNGHWTYKTF